MPGPTFQMMPLNLKDVAVTGGFWAPRIETNRTATLPVEYEQCRKTGRLAAFKLQWKPGDPDPPHIFWDSDVAKWIEAAAYSLTVHGDADLEKLVDDVVDDIAAAQQPDGYLNVHYTVVEPGQRWTNLRDRHELYCAGHLIEAAVAYYYATGKRKLLEVLCRYADHIDATFGREEGKKRGYPGHEELELALVKLCHATGNQKYLNLAKYFIDERGQQPHYFDEEAKLRGDDPAKYWAKNHEYTQSHIPVRQQTEVVGHAVRAFYLYSGMADVAGRTHDEELLAACRRLWADVVEHKLYVHGGIGPSGHNEGFTRPYDLPNETAYAETCAAIALVFFAHRMVQIEADSAYGDVMEQALYNGVLSGVSADGKRFFYENPLAAPPRPGEKALGAPPAAAPPGPHRQEWFGCACCPPNIARLVASIGQYFYSAGKRDLFVHLYADSTASANVAGGRVRLTQKTNYPWDGEVRITLEMDAPASFGLMLRIPAWCRSHKITVNGQRVSAARRKGYARLPRDWNNGDVVELSMEMPVERVVAHPAVLADAGKVAIRRGPVIYCLEQCDHEADVLTIHLPDRTKLTARFDPELFGGGMVIEGVAEAPSLADWPGKLYRPSHQQRMVPANIRAIPYCLWDNRTPGPMTIWLPRS